MKLKTFKRIKLMKLYDLNKRNKIFDNKNENVDTNRNQFTKTLRMYQLWGSETCIDQNKLSKIMT